MPWLILGILADIFFRVNRDLNVELLGESIFVAFKRVEWTLTLSTE